MVLNELTAHRCNAPGGCSAARRAVARALDWSRPTSWTPCICRQGPDLLPFTSTACKTSTTTLINFFQTLNLCKACVCSTAIQAFVGALGRHTPSSASAVELCRPLNECPKAGRRNCLSGQNDLGISDRPTYNAFLGAYCQLGFRDCSELIFHSVGCDAPFAVFACSNTFVPTYGRSGCLWFSTQCFLAGSVRHSQTC